MTTKTKSRFISLALAFALVITSFAIIGSRETYAASKVKRVDLKGAATTDGTAYLKWKKMDNVSGYQIYRKEAGGKWKKVQDVSKKKADNNVTRRDKTVVKIVNKKLKPGKKYSWKVRAYVKNGKRVRYGKFSKVVSAKTKTLEGVRKAVVRVINREFSHNTDTKLNMKAVRNKK